MLLTMPATAATAQDGAVCPSMDAVEEYEARRLELQAFDVTSSTVTSSSHLGPGSPGGVWGPVLSGMSTNSTSVTEEEVERDYRVVTGTGRVITEFYSDGVAYDSGEFWSHVGLRDDFDKQCVPEISEEDYRIAIRDRRRRVGTAWGAAGAAGATGLVGLAASGSKNDTIAGAGTVTAILGASAALVIGATAVFAMESPRPPSPDVDVCPTYTVTEMEAEIRAWNRDLRGDLGCR